MAVASAVTGGIYVSDKRRALEGKWRIPETQLHAAELLGGWPGAWIAHRRLRHKTVKRPYQIIFLAILLLYQVAAADVLLGGLLHRELLEQAGNLFEWGNRRP